MPERSMIKIGGLWIKKTLLNIEYLEGNIGEALLLVFKNKYKDQDQQQEDYGIYVSDRDQSYRPPGQVIRMRGKV